MVEVVKVETLANKLANVEAKVKVDLTYYQRYRCRHLATHWLRWKPRRYWIH